MLGRSDFTQVAVEHIKSGCKLLMENQKETLINQLKRKIESNDTLMNLQENILEHIDDVAGNMPEPFSHIDSTFKQNKYMENKMNLIKPVEIVVGQRAQFVTAEVGGEQQLKLTDKKFYYIPIMKTIQQFLKNRKIREIVQSRKQESPDGFIIDIWNGTTMRNHRYFNDYNTIFLQIYYDDVEVCNPLGGRSHNMAMFYYRISNLDIIYRSKVEAIRMWAVAETKLVKEMGMDCFLRPLVEDLKVMGTVGWDMEFDGIITHFRAFLESVLGDTPAANALLGFKEGVGFAFDKCRLCQCTHDRMQNLFTEDDFIMLTSRDHRHQCNRLETARTTFLRNKLSTLYGINRKTILVQCPKFNICLNTPLDVMHVMLEGVIPYELKELLFHCVEENLFNLDDLSNATNDYYSNFRYDSMTRPTPITALDNLKQTSDQMHSLIRAMPFILSSLIPIHSPEFQFLKQLLQITNILFSAVITLGTLEMLKNLIAKHLQKFKDFFPDKNIIPKQHYLTHFPTLIQKVGPPIRHSASRFESKNKGYKKKIRVSQNFKNVPYSMAMASQRSACLANDFENEHMHPLFQNEGEKGSTKTFDNLNYVKNKLAVFQNIDPLEIISAEYAKSIILAGQKFIKNYTFVAAEVENFLVRFGLIRNIFIVNCSQIFFEIQLYDSHYFDDNFQSFVMDIEEPDMPGATVFVKPGELLDFHAYNLYKQNDDFFLQVPYDLFGILDLGEEKQQSMHNQLNKICN